MNKTKKRTKIGRKRKGEWAKQSLLASIADGMDRHYPAGWDKLFRRSPEKAVEFIQARKAVRARSLALEKEKARRLARGQDERGVNAGTNKRRAEINNKEQIITDFPNGALDRFFDAVEAGQSIEQARMIAGIPSATMQGLIDLGDSDFDTCFAIALQRGGHFEKELRQ